MTLPLKSKVVLVLPQLPFIFKDDCPPNFGVLATYLGRSYRSWLSIPNTKCGAGFTTVSTLLYPRKIPLPKKIYCQVLSHFCHLSSFQMDIKSFQLQESCSACFATFIHNHDLINKNK